MTDALFRIALPNGSRSLALGQPEVGPERLLDPRLTLDGLLCGEAKMFW